MELVNENSILEVGKFYNVRCALMKGKGNPYYVPVIGIPHTDPCFGFNHKHLHIDGRFCGKIEDEKIIMDKNGFTNMVCEYELRLTMKFKISEIVIRRRKCKRLTTGIKPPISKYNMFGEENIYLKWYKTMIGKSCKGKRCPHLGTMMHERNGKLVCPLHNLVGSVKTETIISNGY